MATHTSAEQFEQRPRAGDHIELPASTNVRRIEEVS